MASFPGALEGLLDAAMTVWPAVRAALVRAQPRPEEQPVMRFTNVWNWENMIEYLFPNDLEARGAVVCLKP